MHSLCAGLHDGFGQQRRATANSHRGTPVSAQASRSRRESTLMRLADGMVVVAIDHRSIKIRRPVLGTPDSLDWQLGKGDVGDY